MPMSNVRESKESDSFEMYGQVLGPAYYTALCMVFLITLLPSIITLILENVCCTQNWTKVVKILFSILYCMLNLRWKPLLIAVCYLASFTPVTSTEALGQKVSFNICSSPINRWSSYYYWVSTENLLSPTTLLYKGTKLVASHIFAWTLITPNVHHMKHCLLDPRKEFKLLL